VFFQNPREFFCISYFSILVHEIGSTKKKGRSKKLNNFERKKNTQMRKSVVVSKFSSRQIPQHTQQTTMNEYYV
jgi:hypothetical protein